MARQPTPIRSHAAVDLAEAARLLEAGRVAESVALSQQALKIDPRHPGALRLFAVGAAELGRFGEAKRAASQAQALAPRDPDSGLTLGRVFFVEGDYERAERAWSQVLDLRPDDPEAHRGLINAVWLRTGDIGLALARLDAAIASLPQGGALLALRVDVLRRAGRADQAWAEVLAALSSGQASFALALSAATLALELGYVEDALSLAQSAVEAAPEHPRALDALCGALLANGLGAQALDLTQRILRTSPDRQDVLAMWSTAARLTDHPNYRRVYQYESFVRAGRIDTPKGWPDLAAYLADLRRSLLRIHTEKRHPLDHSLRLGSQTSGDLAHSKDKAVQAFFSAIRPQIEAYIAAVGSGADPLRRRNTGRYRIAGAWSVRLQPGGHHVDHTHPNGWLSSAFYVETPETALTTPGREGWLQFGRPGLPTRPVLEAEHYVRPEPGMLVLFPSYMWHGTVPFTTQESRMTIAFDVQPA